jgi:hypothetical protein
VRLARFFWFLISILFGVAAGLVIGWYLRPTPMSAVAVPALRSDYQTDFALMVAETYDQEKDAPKAAQRLAALSGESPARTAQVAVIRAGELGYDRHDLELLAKLAQALLAVPANATPAVGVKP